MILKRMGYKGEGLVKCEQGMKEPLESTMRPKCVFLWYAGRGKINTGFTGSSK